MAFFYNNIVANNDVRPSVQICNAATSAQVRPMCSCHAGGLEILPAKLVGIGITHAPAHATSAVHPAVHPAAAAHAAVSLGSSAYTGRNALHLADAKAF